MPAARLASVALLVSVARLVSVVQVAGFGGSAGSAGVVGSAGVPSGPTLALVTNFNDDTVSVIDLTGESPVVKSETLSVGDRPHGVAIHPDG